MSVARAELAVRAPVARGALERSAAARGLRTRRFLAICVAGVGAAGLAFLLSWDAPMDAVTYATAFGAMVVLGLLPTAIRYHGTPYDWISPVTLFSATYAFVFTFGSIYQAAGILPLSRAQSLAEFPAAMLYAVLGLAGFQVGYFRAPWRRRPAPAAVVPWQWKRATAAYHLLLLLTWAARFYLAAIGVGSGRVSFFLTRELSFWEIFLMAATQWLSFGIAPLALLLRRYRGNRTLWVSPVAAIAAEFLYWTLLSWRSQVLINAVALIVTYVLLTPRLRVRRFMAISAIAALTMLPVIDTMRMLLGEGPQTANPLVYVASEVLPRSVGATFRDPSAYGTAVAGVYREISGRLNPLDFFAEVIGPVRAHGYMFGQTLVANLWVLVPRLLWPDKPSAIGAKNIIQEWYGLWMEDTMLTPPLELYANFGLPGVLLGMLVFGLFTRAIFLWSLLRSPGPRGIFLYAVTASLYLFHERDLFNSTIDFLRLWLLFWLVTWWIERGHHHRSDRTRPRDAALSPGVLSSAHSAQ